MKHIRKFNEELSNDGISSINDLKEIFSNGINVPVFLEDLVSGTGIILLTTSGKVFEKPASSDDWKEYDSVESFKSDTGASLDEEYAGNKSQQLLNLITGADGEYDGIDDYRVGDIDSIYFEGEPTNMLKKLLERYD